MEAMFLKIFSNPWVLGGGVAVILAVAAKFVDEEKAYATGKTRGQFITKMMSSTNLGKKSWEKIETFVQRVGMAYFRGFMDGLDSDDNETQNQEEPKK